MASKVQPNRRSLLLAVIIALFGTISVTAYTSSAYSFELPVVLFLHGTHGTAKVFQGLVNDKQLQQKAQLIAVDRPGHARDSATFLDLRAQAEFFTQLMLVQFPNRRYIVVGDSYGAIVALKMAVSQPRFLAGVVTLSAMADPKEIEESRIFAWTNFASRLGKSSSGEQEILRLPSELRVLSGELKQIEVPVRLMHGTDDSRVEPINVYKLEFAIGNEKTQREFVSKAGHQLISSRPDIVKRAILAVLEDVDRLK